LRILCALFLRGLVSNFMAYMSEQLMKVAFKEPVIRPLPLPDERQAILEQIRTKVSLYLFLFAVCHPFSTELCQTVLLHQPIKYRAKDLELSFFFFLSFNLRHTEKEKKEPVVRPVTNINVAAILEKANAIRQVRVTTIFSALLFKVKVMMV